MLPFVPHHEALADSSTRSALRYVGKWLLFVLAVPFILLYAVGGVGWTLFVTALSTYVAVHVDGYEWYERPGAFLFCMIAGSVCSLFGRRN